jgi:GNAT superfamily N-acetyltransferase
MNGAEGPVEVAAPTRAELAAIGPVLARAFLDDPVWSTIGPRSRRYRAIVNRAAFWGVVNASARHGARIRVARLSGAGGVGGRLLGATIGFEPGRWPPPERATAWELGWALLAGPLPVRRGVRAEGAMREAHVSHPHVYLWYIGVEPGHQGRGIGRALMADLHQRADDLGVPTYLETGTRPNIDFYRSLGYELEGELRLPDGLTLWPMERPAEA